MQDYYNVLTGQLDPQMQIISVQCFVSSIKKNPDKKKLLSDLSDTAWFMKNVCSSESLFLALKLTPSYSLRAL